MSGDSYYAEENETTQSGHNEIVKGNFDQIKLSLCVYCDGLPIIGEFAVCVVQE